MECASGFCVDGLCCDQACGGQCEACDVVPNEGTCVPVTGPPHGTRAECESDGSECAGECNGINRASCSFRAAGESCGEGSCTGSTETSSSCNGTGSCVPEERDCSPFVCDAEACLTSCSDDAHCTQGFRCDPTSRACVPAAGRCQSDGVTLETSTGELRDCSPYRCQAGECSDPCVTSGDCTSGNICDQGACVAFAEQGAGDDGGCGCRLATRARGSSAWAALGLVVALLGRRRRRTKSLLST
jgi:MYXO-CTERM domain-containing protein